MTDRRLEQERGRVRALDVVRGFVMVVMTLDHASGAYNAGRVMSDGAAMVHPGTVLDPAQFLVRWVTHLCAPTFVFLAGVSLALSVARRRRAAVPAAQIDRDLAVRGGVLIVLELAWMSWVWRLGAPIQLGVLYAIGASMIAMIGLRRLSPGLVGSLGVMVIVAGDALRAPLDPATVLAAATMTGGRLGDVIVLYPFVPWLGIMMLGWAIGTRLAGDGVRARDWLALAGIAAVTFVVVRGLNGYGNAGLLRADGSWLEWLHVSKYPPSVAYVGLELALAFGLLALAWRLPVARPWTWLGVLGQTALFYYLLHVHVLKLGAVALGLYKTGGLGTVAVAWLAVLVALYPACRWYLGLKRRHPLSVLRFL